MRIAINGFGRIGRIFFRQAFGKENFDIVAINDLSSVDNLAYLLKYDTVYGHYEKEISFTKGDEGIIKGFGKGIAKGDEGSVKGFDRGIAKGQVLVFSESNPENLPWKDLNIDVVVEATGFFTDSEKASVHIKAGAKRVLITAPTKDETPIFTPGLTPKNPTSEVGESRVISNASCTTNAVNPVIAIMMETVGIKKAVLNTIHAYTATQAIIDGISKTSDYRRGRAGAQNIIPSTTGAAEATIKTIPALRNKFDGVAIRVPVISGSIADITFISERPTTVQEINDIFKKAAASPRWQGILKVIDEQIVSSDILKEPYGAIIDLTLTKVVDKDLVKVFSWYDNEWGYAAMLIKQLEQLF
jgi:glyceraldehyde 3-phosphate dehydrogenase